MPLLALVPLFLAPVHAGRAGDSDPRKVHAAKAVHHRKQQAQRPRKAPLTDARTLLPMTGESRGNPAPSPTNPIVAAQNPSTPGQNQVTGPPTILIPDDVPNSTGKTPGFSNSPGSAPRKKWQTVTQLYFDAGAEDLVGSFTTLILRAGMRYYDDELDVYFRNETLDTEGTGLPFQQVISGASVGGQWRHWFFKNHVFVTVSDGVYLSGPFKDHADFRVGAVGAFGWQSDKMFTDIYSDLFYVNLLSDTIFTARVRSGPILLKNKAGQVIAYGVAQFIGDSQGKEGSENRAEVGFGAGYLMLGHFALNVDLRAGYGYRGYILNRAYLNPMIVLSGSF